MDLIISTFQFLIVYNFDKNKWFVIHQNDGVYFGLAKYKDWIIAGKRNTDSLMVSNLQKIGASFIVLNKQLKVIDEIKPKFPIRDLHGIKVIKDELWVTSCFDNIIGIYNFLDHSWRYWLPETNINEIKEVNQDLISKLKNNKTKDVNHFNSININNNYLNLVAHNWGESEIYFYNLKNLQFIKKIKLGIKSHDIWYRGDEIFTLSSQTGQIISSKHFKLNVGGFLRGFTSNKNRIFFGSNEFKSDKKNRKTSSFYIKSCNNNFKETKNYFFKGLGDVMDILYIDNLNYL